MSQSLNHYPHSPQKNSTSPSTATVFFILTGLVAFVVLLSIFVFSKQSLRLDEAQSLWQTSHSPVAIINIIAQDVHVPLYHFILHYWQLYLGNGVVTGRILSLIFFIASIPAIYFLGKQMLSKRIGIFAAILLAISPFMNWYGNEIRMYSLLTLLAILSQYFFIRIYQTRDGDSWVGYFVVCLLGIFTHYFFFFIILVQAIFFLLYNNLFKSGSAKRFLLIISILFIAFAPWLLYVKTLGKVGNETPLLATPNSVNVFNTFSQFIFGFQNDHLNTVLVSLWPLTVLLGFLALRENKRISPEVIYLVMSVIIPIALAFIVSIVLTPLFVSRYLILTIPSLYLFIGWIFSTYPRRLSQILKIILIVGMLTGLTVEAMSNTNPAKENYAEATSFLETHAAPQDVIILSAPFTVYPVEYYYHGTTEIDTLPIWDRNVNGPIPPYNPKTLPEEVATLTKNRDNVWLLLSYDQGYEEDLRLYFDNHFQRILVKNFSNDLNLYEYKLQYGKEFPNF